MPWSLLLNVLGSIAQNVGLAAGLWAWASFWTVAMARIESKRGHVTATRRSLTLATVLAIVLVTTASATFLLKPDAEVLGIKQLKIPAPFDWWIWIAILVIEPIVCARKFFRYRAIFAEEAARRGHPTRVTPNLVVLAERLIESGADGGNYVG